MKKITSIFILVFLSITGNSQLINRDNWSVWMGNMYLGHPRTGPITLPNSSVHLQLGDSATTKALWLPRVQDTSDIPNPRQGMFIYSISQKSTYFRSLDAWLRIAVDALPDPGVTSNVWYVGGQEFPTIPPAGISIGTGSAWGGSFSIKTNGLVRMTVPDAGLLPFSASNDVVLVKDVSDNLGVISKSDLVSSVGWLNNGNTGTNPYVNFAGTTDNAGISIRTNNKYAGRFDSLQRFQAEWITGINDTASEFEIVLIPDTQNEVDSAITRGQTTGRSIFQWIKDNAVSQNIKAAIGLGDITNESTAIQRDTADKWYDLLDDAGIPYVPTIGNHDYNGNLPATRNASNYLATFGPARLTGKSWYGGSYWKAPENFWVNFDVMGRPFTVLSLEYWPRDSTLLWADSLVTANPDRNFIYVTHAYLTAFGERSADSSLWGNNVTGQGADNSGQEQWDKFVKKHKNIQFVFNGHFLGHDVNHKSGYTRNFDDLGTNGNVVHQLFVNYQTDTAGGNGWFTRMRFKPKENLIEVTYYSAHLGRYDDRVLSFTYYFPPLQIQSDAGIQGNLVVDKFGRFNRGISFPFLKKYQIPFLYENGNVSGGDSLKYNKITGEFSVNTPTDLGNYKTQLTGEMINKSGSILVDGGNVTTKSSTGVQTGFIGEGYAGSVATWQIGSSGTSGNGTSLYYVSSSGTHGQFGTVLFDAEKALQVSTGTSVPLASFYMDSRYVFIHGSDVANAHYYRPTDAMLTVAGKDSTTGLALRVSSLAQNASPGDYFPHQFSVANNGTSTFWNNNQSVTTQGKTKLVLRNGFRQGATNLFEVRQWDDTLNAYIDSFGIMGLKRRLYISGTRTVPNYTANLHIVHGSGNFGIGITRASNDNGGANLTYFKTRSSDPTVNTAAVEGDIIHNNYFYTVSGNGSRVLAHERNSYAKVVGTSYVSAYWRWAGYNESGSYITQMYLMPDGAISIGVNPTFPDSSAILDLQSTIKAFYPPRMNTTQMNAIWGVDAGAMLYNTDSSAYCFYDGGAWKKFGSGGGAGSVTSVALSMPAAFSVSGSPITGSGTFSVTGAGTTSQYVQGDGTLATFNTSARSAISLTTTGTSGAATYNSGTGVLNIPQYATAPGGSTKQFQFNDAGAFAGSGNLTQETNQILVTGTAGTVPFVVRGHEDNAQGPISEWQEFSGSAALFRVNQDTTVEFRNFVGTVTAPAAGFLKVYARGDSLRAKNSAGVEFTLGIAGGSGSGTVNTGAANKAAYYPSGGTTVDDVAGAEFNGTNKILDLTAQAATDVPLTINGATSQSANLLHVKNSIGSTLFRVGPEGYSTAILAGDVLVNRYLFGAPGLHMQINAGESWSVHDNGPSGAILQLTTGSYPSYNNATFKVNGGLIVNDDGINGNAVRFEGDTDDNLFVTDPANSRIGIGTASPSEKLHVNGYIVSNAPAYSSGGYDVLVRNQTSGRYETTTISSGIADPGSNGILARTALNTTAARTLTGTSNKISITNGDGVSGNPTFDVGSDIVQLTSTQTLTNKRITPRDGSTTSSATPTINTDNVDQYRITAQTVDITSMTTNLSGTPSHGQRLLIEITGTASRAITWGSSFEASTIALPTTTSGTNMLSVLFTWNSTTSKWRIAGTW